MGTELITIEKPAPPQLVADMAPLVLAAREFQVVDEASDRIAQERGAILRRSERAGEEHFAKAKKAASEAHKTIVAAINSMIGPWAEARSIYFKKSDEWQGEQRLKAMRESHRLQEEARKVEEERKLLEAIEAEASGDVAGAEAILIEPTPAPIITVAPAVAKVDGVSSVTRWSARITDMLALVRYVAQHPEWLPLLEVERLLDEHPNLNRLAVAQRGALSFPGVKAVSTTTRSTR